MLFRFLAICFLVSVLLTVPTFAQSNSLEDCILIIGDSIPAGQAVAEVPGYGFPVIVSAPFTLVLDTYYNEQRITHIGIHNLSVGASSLGIGGNVRYFDTPQYTVARSKRCQFAVVFPFINNLPDTPDAAAIAAYIQSLWLLSTTLHTDTQIVILDYYRIVVTELGERVYSTSITPPVIGAMNTAIAAACADNGILGALPNVTCFHIEPYLFPLDDALMRSITPTQFYTEGFYAADGLGQAWLTQFWASNPNAAINVDGVHLNSAGKRRLAEALHFTLQTINPSAFQTIAPL